MNAPLAFLQVDGGPAARSPLADQAVAAGARLEVHDGWEIPITYGDVAEERRASCETVAWVDASHLRKLELQGAPEQLATIVGAAPSFRDAQPLADGWWCQITPTRALVLSDAPDAVAIGGADVSAIDVTAAYAALRIAGPLARETFARFCALDLRDQAMPVGAFRPGSVARTPGFVLREAANQFLMVFGAGYAGYVWDVVSDAGGHLGGRPAGQGVLDA